MPPTTSRPWSEEALFGKAVTYAERIGASPDENADGPLRSALTLEFLARAALAHISPVLLAEKEWRNSLHALGHPITAAGFVPRSITTAEVLRRLKELVPEFTTEHHDFCSGHVHRRNAELHTGEIGFLDVDSAWLPRFYAASKALLVSMGRELNALIDDAASAEEMIQSLGRDAREAVTQLIASHAARWQDMTDAERTAATAPALGWATRRSGHRVVCPACQCQALLHGTPIGHVTTTVTDDEVVQRQAAQPSSFECIACRLRIAGLSKLAACGLGTTFITTTTHSAAEYFDLYTSDQLEEARGEYREEEPDFNEF